MMIWFLPVDTIFGFVISVKNKVVYKNTKETLIYIQ